MGELLRDSRLLKKYVSSRLQTLQMRLAHGIEYSQLDSNDVARVEGGLQELRIVLDYIEKCEDN